MTAYEYKVVPAPAKGEKAKGVRGAEARFAFALEQAMNQMGAEGWEYLRAETLPSEERSGLTGTVTTWRNVLVFRRRRADDLSAFEPRLLHAPTPSAEDAPVRPTRPVAPPVPKTDRPAADAAAASTALAHRLVAEAEDTIRPAAQPPHSDPTEPETAPPSAHADAADSAFLRTDADTGPDAGTNTGTKTDTRAEGSAEVDDAQHAQSGATRDEETHPGDTLAEQLPDDTWPETSRHATGTGLAADDDPADPGIAPAIPASPDGPGPNDAATPGAGSAATTALMASAALGGPPPLPDNGVEDTTPALGGVGAALLARAARIKGSAPATDAKANGGGGTPGDKDDLAAE